MNLNQFYHYYKSKSGGEANLLKATEDFDSSIDWNKLPSTDAPTVSGGITDPNGGSDAQRINFTDNRQARVQQRVSLSASTQYTFSVYARVNTGTENFRLRNVTLSEAEGKTATTSWTRFEYTFTTTTGGNYDLSIQNTDNVAKTIEFWGAMLNVGASANAYVKVDPSISGSTPTPAYSGFGDTYGDVTAYYSLRKFTEAETLNAIRVRRSSDDTEQDIGFDANGELDTTALLAFVGTGGTDNGYVTTFYDQSGNGNNAINATESEQPLIVSAGSLTQLNSKAAINGDGADDVLSVSTGVDLSSGYSIFHVSQVPSANTYGITLSNSAGNDRNLIFDSIYRFQLDGTNNNNNGASGNRGAQYLWSLVNDASGNLDMNRNGSAYGSQLTGLTGTFTFENIGTNIGVNSFEYFQELIIFNSDQSTNRTGMETNINDHFSIYP